MKRVAVVYWSGTGNTEIMAQKVVEGAKASGADVDVFTATSFNEILIDSYDVIAFGCPAMGSEQLEDSEFEPMFEKCRPKLSGKQIALFGSFGWGGGEWMRDWEQNSTRDGAILVCEGLIQNETPDAEGEAACVDLGKKLAE